MFILVSLVCVGENEKNNGVNKVCWCAWLNILCVFLKL